MTPKTKNPLTSQRVSRAAPAAAPAWFTKNYLVVSVVVVVVLSGSAGASVVVVLVVEVVVGLILIQQDLRTISLSVQSTVATALYYFATAMIPVVVLASGLLMVSAIRYPHVVNKYLRGKRSIQWLVGIVAVLLLLLIFPRYTLGLGMIAFAAGSPIWFFMTRRRPLKGSIGPTAATQPVEQS